MAASGPGSILLAETISCAMLFCALDPVAEVMIFQPSGSFISVAHRYIDPAWAFTVGWVYIFHCLATIPLNLIVAAKIMVSVVPSVHLAGWLSTFIVSVSGIVLSRPTYLVEISMLMGVIKLAIMLVIGLVVNLFSPFQYAN